MKHFTDQEIEDAIKKVPKSIHDEISSGEDTAIVVAQIGQKYGLHIDQIGILAELNRNMLLGLIGPEEFLKELVAAGVSDTDARQIMTEINQKIFVPLREQMRSGAGNTQPVKSAEPTKPAMPMPSEATFRSPTPANPQLPPRPPQINASVPRYIPPAPPTPPAPQHFHLENKIPPPPTPSASPSGLSAALKQVLNEGGQTSLNPSEKLLEDHEEPSPSLKATEGTAHIEISEKIQGASSSSVIPPGARFSPPPVIPKVEPPLAPKPPVPLPPPTLPPTPSSTPPELAKSYVDDPYREPIDTQ